MRAVSRESIKLRDQGFAILDAAGCLSQTNTPKEPRGTAHIYIYIYREREIIA